MSDPLTLSALQLGRAIEAGTADPVDLAEEALTRIAAQDPDRRIFVRLAPDRTRAEALAARDRSRSGLRRGPLDGVPVAWKDNVETAGVITAAGSRLLETHVPVRDAAILERASRAGTVFLGKTNLTEIAFSGLGINPVTGTPANAFDPETPRIPGGSSSGSAVAMARGLAPLAVGTDTGGSVRIPAAWANLVGLKTTAGLIPTQGIVPLARSLDTVGPLARDVADAAAFYALLSERPAPDLAGADLRGVPILALDHAALAWCEAPVLDAFEAALEALARAGAVIRRGPFPAFTGLIEARKRHRVGGVPEATAEWEGPVSRHGDLMYRFIRDRLAEADDTTGVGLAGYQNTVLDLSRRAAADLAGIGALATPTAGLRPPPIAALETDFEAYIAANGRALRLTTLVNMLGLCAATVPAGFSPADAAAPAMPFGLHLVGPPHRDAAILRLSAAAERALAPLNGA